MLCVFVLFVVVGEESVDEPRDAREDVAQRGPRVEAVDAPLGVRERERVDARPAPAEGPARHRRVGEVRRDEVLGRPLVRGAVRRDLAVVGGVVVVVAEVDDAVVAVVVAPSKLLP